MVECRTWDREGGEGGNAERKKQGLGKCRTRKIGMGENSNQKKNATNCTGKRQEAARPWHRGGSKQME